jgi:hypothetical protein
MELPAEDGFDGMGRAVTVVLIEVMEWERTHAPGAAPCQRSERRSGLDRDSITGHPAGRSTPQTVTTTLPNCWFDSR